MTFLEECDEFVFLLREPKSQAPVSIKMCFLKPCKIERVPTSGGIHHAPVQRTFLHTFRRFIVPYEDSSRLGGGRYENERKRQLSSTYCIQRRRKEGHANQRRGFGTDVARPAPRYGVISIPLSVS